MRTPLALSLLLAGGAAAGLPAVTAAQDGPTADPARLTLSKPLPTGCFSNPVAGRSGPTAPSVVLPEVGLTGGPAGQRFSLVARPVGTMRNGESGLSSGRFDAAGNATVNGYTLAKFAQPGPGSTYKLTVAVGPNGNQSSQPGDLANPFSKDLGTVTFAAHSGGIQRPAGGFRRGRPHRVVVSGAPLARKTLYGFLVKADRQVLTRFKLGTADACGYATAKAVTWPSSFRDFESLKVYVVAGPKFDKARALLKFRH